MPTIKIDDIDLYYEEHGDADAHPVLLISGFITNAASWAPQVAALAPHYHVVAVDNRGSGRSSQREGPYSTPQMAADGAALLDRLRIESAHIVGASMGGMIAQEFALHYPARVRGLVLACTTPGGPRSFGYDEMLRAKDETPEVDDLSQVWTPERVREYALQLFTPEFLAKPTPEFGQYIAGVMRHPSTLVGLKAQAGAVLAHDCFDRLPQIQQPTLVIAGEDDTLVDARNSPLLAQHVPHAELRMFPRLRHGFTAEDPAAVNEVILEFLARVAVSCEANN